MTNRRCRRRTAALMAAVVAGLAASPGRAADEPDLIFKRSTVFKWLTPNDKLATYGLDDPEVDGVACHFTVPEKGGFKGWIGVAEEVSDISLACRQIGPIRFKRSSPRARTCSAPAVRCSSRRCRSCGAAM
jgi:CreA protein